MSKYSDDMSKTLTVKEALTAFKTYVETLRSSPHGDPHQPTLADIDHSFLLRRLLSGKPLLKDPPPTCFSYPNYELADTGTCLPHDVKEYADIPGKVIIDQSSWNVVEKKNVATMIVTWGDQPTRYLLEWIPYSHTITTCEGTTGKWREEQRDGWVMKRMET